jgi:hypothetical protein
MLATASESLQPFLDGTLPADPSFVVRRTGGHLFELSIGGRFYPGWSGSLVSGLAQRRIGIVRGFARKVEALRWQACFELEPAPGAESPLVLDYLELASRSAGPRARVPIRLDRHELCTSGAHGGSIEVRVEGADQVGFLGSLLQRFAFLALFPEQMAVDTRQGHVHDAFGLKGIGRTVPSDETRGALSRALRRLETGERFPPGR